VAIALGLPSWGHIVTREFISADVDVVHNDRTRVIRPHPDAVAPQTAR